MDKNEKFEERDNAGSNETKMQGIRDMSYLASA